MKKVSTLYLIIIVIGVITSIPVLGSLIDFDSLLSISLLVGSIYLLVRHPKGINKKATSLMIISVTFYMLSSLGVLIGIVEDDNLILLLLSVLSWLLKIKSLLYFIEIYKLLENKKNQLFFQKNEKNGVFTDVSFTFIRDCISQIIFGRERKYGILNSRSGHTCFK